MTEGRTPSELHTLGIHVELNTGKRSVPWGVCVKQANDKDWVPPLPPLPGHRRRHLPTIIWVLIMLGPGSNYGEMSEDGVFLRPNVTNAEAMAADYTQQSLVPLDFETHSGAGQCRRS